MIVHAFCEMLSHYFCRKVGSRRFRTALTLQKRIFLFNSWFLPNFQAFVSNLRAIPDRERPKYDSRDIHGFKDTRGPWYSYFLVSLVSTTPILINTCIRPYGWGYSPFWQPYLNDLPAEWYYPVLASPCWVPVTFINGTIPFTVWPTQLTHLKSCLKPIVLCH